MTGVRRLSVPLLAVTLAAVAGCSKKETPSAAATEVSAPTPQPQAPAPTHAPTPAPPPAQAPAPAADMDTVVNDRSIAYLRSLVARKDYPRAREALKMFEGRTLSPAQQQALDQIKAQIPPG